MPGTLPNLELAADFCSQRSPNMVPPHKLLLPDFCSQQQQQAIHVTVSQAKGTSFGSKGHSLNLIEND